MTFQLKQGDKVLFQGDSITDCGRNRDVATDLGKGYPLMVAAAFGAAYPELGVTFINRGIGGNRVVNLQSRWQEDCLDLQPDWVSIYIGINDCWRRYDKNDATSVESFEDGYRDLIERTKQHTNAKLVFVEPFVLPYPEDRIAWREDLDPKIEVVRKLAQENNAPLVPLDGIFAKISKTPEPKFWAPDGVHPTPAGHAIVAKAWMKTMGVLPE